MHNPALIRSCPQDGAIDKEEYLATLQLQLRSKFFFAQSQAGARCRLSL